MLQFLLGYLPNMFLFENSNLINNMHIHNMSKSMHFAWIYSKITSILIIQPTKTSTYRFPWTLKLTSTKVKLLKPPNRKTLLNSTHSLHSAEPTLPAYHSTDWKYRKISRKVVLRWDLKCALQVVPEIKYLMFIFMHQLGEVVIIMAIISNLLLIKTVAPDTLCLIVS